ncbi:chlorite dismutase family protein [Virgibacillus halophilus]|uniref:Coproheme decarboxylase n=1 Tax=Tigheibacillus halophilus TaxID=361280 RepID=A0ABU5CCH0_9BACI|nr:chlorite dismutase family protein [Virgibacillus halophilus]
MVETVETYDGWSSLHDFRTMNWEKWQQLTNERKGSLLNELHTAIKQWEHTVEEKEGSHAIYTIAGSKADLMFMILRPEIKDIIDWKTKFNKLEIAHLLEPKASFVSIIEKSSYTKPETDPYHNPEMLKKALSTNSI